MKCTHGASILSQHAGRTLGETVSGLDRYTYSFSSETQLAGLQPGWMRSAESRRKCEMASQLQESGIPLPSALETFFPESTPSVYLPFCSRPRINVK